MEFGGSAAGDWIAAAVTLVLGVAVAAAVAAFVNLVARRLLADQRGAGRVAGAVFWTIGAVAVLLAIGRLAEPAAAETGLAAAATRFLLALPDLLVGLLVLVLGWALAVALRTLLRQVLQRLRPGVGEPLPSIGYWSVLVLAALVAADQVGIEVGLLRSVLLLLLAGLVLAAAIALGVGSRDLVAAVVAGRHVTSILGPGDEIEVAGHRGTVVSVGHASVRLATDTGEVELPHPTLLANAVTLRTSGRA